jgi:hypothetical protein
MSNLPQNSAEHLWLETFRSLLRKDKGTWFFEEEHLSHLAAQMTMKLSAAELYDQTIALVHCIEGMRDMPGGANAAEQAAKLVAIPLMNAVAKSARGQAYQRRQAAADAPKNVGMAPPSGGVGFRRRN